MALRGAELLAESFGTPGGKPADLAATYARRWRAEFKKRLKIAALFRRLWMGGKAGEGVVAALARIPGVAGWLIRTTRS